MEALGQVIGRRRRSRGGAAQLEPAQRGTDHRADRQAEDQRRTEQAQPRPRLLANPLAPLGLFDQTRQRLLAGINGAAARGSGAQRRRRRFQIRLRLKRRLSFGFRFRLQLRGRLRLGGCGRSAVAVLLGFEPSPAVQRQHGARRLLRRFRPSGWRGGRCRSAAASVGCVCRHGSTSLLHGSRLRCATGLALPTRRPAPLSRPPRRSAARRCLFRRSVARRRPASIRSA